MTNEEADKIAENGSKVDSGCSVCVRSFTEQLMRDFPDIDWKAKMLVIAARDRHYWVKEIADWTAEERW